MSLSDRLVGRLGRCPLPVSPDDFTVSAVRLQPASRLTSCIANCYCKQYEASCVPIQGKLLAGTVRTSCRISLRLEGAMTFQGTVIREQRVTFAVVVVKKHVIDSRIEADQTIAAFQPVFPGLPVVLMAQDSRA